MNYCRIILFVGGNTPTVDNDDKRYTEREKNLGKFAGQK